MKRLILLILSLLLVSQTAHANIYRQVILLIDNNTPNMITFDGYAVIRGSWTAGFEPQMGSVIAPHSISVIKADSSMIGVGTAGFVRMASADDIMSIDWNVPWDTWNRTQEIRTASSYGDIKFHVVLQNEEPDMPLYHIVISEMEP